MKTKLLLSTAVVGMLTAVAVLLPSCGSSSDNEETGQQVGDVMASVDESGGSSGSLAMVPAESFRKTFKRLSPSDISPTWFETLLEQEANATSCRLANTFGTCTNNVITRTFGDCTVGGATFSGTVTLTFDDAAVNSTCQMTAATHSITRVPAFTVTGRRNPTRFYNRRRRNHFRLHHGNDFRHHGNGYQPRESHHERWHAARDQ